MMINYRSKTREVLIAAADGAQTNLDISPRAIAAGERLVIHQIQAAIDNDISANVAVRIGFAAATLPAAALAGAEGIILSHPDFAPGSGMPGLFGIGAAGEELRLTCDAPTAGNLVINYRYEIVPA